MADPQPPSATSGVDPPRAGLRIDGRYVLERLLGRGGMGEVWYARDEQGGVVVALKFVRGKGGEAPSAGDRTRQLREARAAQRIRHPNVVELHGVVDDAERGPVLVMQYLEGESLSERLERAGPLPLVEAGRLALELCEGLAAAHAAGVLHRDLKPSNVLLVPGVGGEPPARACIVDFGVAKLLPLTLDAASSTQGGFAGTPLYMAPEQLFGAGDVDHRADVWSLGLLLFAALTGRTPTQGAHLGEVMRNVLDRPVPRARSFAPDLPAELDEALARALSRERRMRPSLAELAAAFAPFAGREAPALPEPRLAAPLRAFDRAPIASETLDASGDAGFPLTLGADIRDLPPTLDADVRGGPSADGSSPPSVSPRPPRPPRSRASLGAAALALVVLAGVGVGVSLRPGWRHAFARRGAGGGVASFAVIAPGDGVSPNAWSANAIARALALRWAGSAALRVVPPERAAGPERARALARSEAGEEEAARAAAEELGVEALVVVRAAAPGQATLARLALYSRAGGFRREGSMAVEPDADPAELLGAARFVREGLNVSDGVSGDRSVAALGLPAEPAALRHALLGERALRAGDVAGARRELEAEGMTAASLDAPTLQLFEARLKAAEGRLATAWSLAVLALRTSDRLLHDERLAFEAEAHRLSSERDRGLDEQRALWASRPDALEHGYRLGQMLLEQSNFVEAKGLLEQVAARLDPADDDGRVRLLLGLARLSSGERERGAEDVAAGLERATRAGDTSGAARAHLALAELARGTDLARRREHAERASALFGGRGDAVGVASAELVAADASLSLDRDDEALAAAEHARGVVPPSECFAIEAAAGEIQAAVADRRGDYLKANGFAEPAMLSARGHGTKALLARVLNRAGTANVHVWSQERGLALLRESVAVAKGIGDGPSAAAALQSLALAHLRAGDAASARLAAAESLALYREAGDRYDIVGSLDALGQVELSAGRPAEARTLVEEALRLRERTGRVGGQSRKLLAALLGVEGRPAEALAACQRAADELHERKLFAPEAEALTLLAGLALDAGDAARARAAADRALSLGDDWLRLFTRPALASSLERLDVAASKARLAARDGCRRPQRAGGLEARPIVVTDELCAEHHRHEPQPPRDRAPLHEQVHRREALEVRARPGRDPLARLDVIVFELRTVVERAERRPARHPVFDGIDEALGQARVEAANHARAQKGRRAHLDVDGPRFARASQWRALKLGHDTYGYGALPRRAKGAEYQNIKPLVSIESLGDFSRGGTTKLLLESADARSLSATLSWSNCGKPCHEKPMNPATAANSTFTPMKTWVLFGE